MIREGDEGYNAQEKGDMDGDEKEGRRPTTSLAGGNKAGRGSLVDGEENGERTHEASWDSDPGCTLTSPSLSSRFRRLPTTICPFQFHECLMLFFRYIMIPTLYVQSIANSCGKSVYLSVTRDQRALYQALCTNEPLLCATSTVRVNNRPSSSSGLFVCACMLDGQT